MQPASLNLNATGGFEAIIHLGEIPWFAVIILRLQKADLRRIKIEFYAACDRRGVVMIIGAVRRFEDLQPGAWFYFNRLGAAGVALKVIDKIGVGLPPGSKYIVLDPEVGRLKSTNWSAEMGVYEIPEAMVLPMPGHASYQSENAPFFAGALVFGGETQYLAFAAGDFAGFADMKSGEIQIDPPERPCGWFNDWRLLQRGPNEFEKILTVTAAHPGAPNRVPSGAPADRGNLADDDSREVGSAREAVRVPPLMSKKQSRVRGKSSKPRHS